jgi:hypothetical protein
VILPEELIIFNENTNIVQLDGCINSDDSIKAIENIITFPLALPMISSISVPDVKLSNYPETFSLCEEYDISIKNFFNTGQRQPDSIKWSLKTSEPVLSSDFKNKIDEILQ